ncbi:hypothetical protein [Parasitella parasitica]|uniref:Uncharacterized protein n=1 Tax=Parasitella parasitica TaxID=35722 RepID=A0A0B7MQ39_9FUNG|nr:hypothetical protein [Parasitella parasitica]
MTVYAEVRLKSMPPYLYNTALNKKRKFDEITSENYLSEDQDLDEPIEIEDAQDESMDLIEILKKGLKKELKALLGGRKEEVVVVLPLRTLQC